MATILDIIKGLNQAASNAYDGYQTMDDKIGLKREEGNPILDSRLMDGFAVRFAGQNIIVTYQSEISMKEIHPRPAFENEIELRFGDIIKFLKKEYKKITKESVSLTEVAPADILVQSTSRVRNWVQATKQYTIGSVADTEAVRSGSTDDLEANIKQFMDKYSTKTAPNDERSRKQGYSDRDDEALGKPRGTERGFRQDFKDRREDSHDKLATRPKRNSKTNK